MKNIHPKHREGILLDPEPAKEEKSPLHSQTLVLLADDDTGNLSVLKAQLGSLYRIQTARDGVETLEKIKEELPDLLVLDLVMPRMNGYEVCQEIRKNPETTYLPVLMLTARNQREDLTRGFQSGADDYLTKPLREFNKNLYHFMPNRSA